MTQRVAIDLLADHFGGSVRVSDNGTNHKPVYRWQRVGRSAEETLRRLSPYIRIKAKQVETAFNLMAVIEKNAAGKKLGPYERSSDDYLSECHRLYLEMRALNFRGRP